MIEYIFLHACFTSAWEKKVSSATQRYKLHMTSWLETFQFPVHVLVYEELQKNTLWELYKVSKFINVPVTFKTFWCIIQKTKEQTKFLRQKPDWLKADILFTDSMKKKMNFYLRAFMNGPGKKHHFEHSLESYIL